MINKNYIIFGMVMLLSILSVNAVTFTITNCTSPITIQSNTTYELSGLIDYDSNNGNFPNSEGCLNYNGGYDLENVLIDGKGQFYGLRDNASLTVNNTHIAIKMVTGSNYIHNVEIKDLYLYNQFGGVSISTGDGSIGISDVKLSNIHGTNNYLFISLDSAGTQTLFKNITMTNIYGNSRLVTNQIIHGNYLYFTRLENISINNLVLNNVTSISNSVGQIGLFSTIKDLNIQNLYINSNKLQVGRTYFTMSPSLINGVVNNVFVTNLDGGGNALFSASNTNNFTLTNITFDNSLIQVLAVGGGNNTLFDNWIFRNSFFKALFNTGVSNNLVMKNIYIYNFTQANSSSTTRGLTINNVTNVLLENFYVDNYRNTSTFLTFNQDTNLLLINNSNNRDYFSTATKLFVMTGGTIINTSSNNNVGWFPRLQDYNGNVNGQSATAYYNYSNGYDANLTLNSSLHTYYNNNGYVPSCTEDWVQYNTTCNGVNFTVLYNDTQSCGTNISLPINNGTFVSCCIENWVQYNTTCNTYNFTTIYNDTNSCGTFTTFNFSDNGTVTSCYVAPITAHVTTPSEVNSTNIKAVVAYGTFGILIMAGIGIAFMLKAKAKE